MNLSGGQDWAPVVIRKKPEKSSDLKDEKTVNAVRGGGAPRVAIVEKLPCLTSSLRAPRCSAGSPYGRCN
jgi:hypothetical protein